MLIIHHLFFSYISITFNHNIFIKHIKTVKRISPTTYL